MAVATEGLEKLEDMIVRQAEATGAQVAAAKAAIGNVIFGQERVVEQALITVLCGGHALLIGLPGLAKTKLVETMGIVLGLDARRIQFTPDLMPSDILGSEVLEEGAGGKRSFRFIPGPIFGQLLMADEINRASPRTQSALLQAMQEQHVTVAGNRHDVPRPFHVLATQNPIEQEGTYPLPEAQLDRFLMQIDVDYPDHDAERKIVFDTTGAEENKPKPTMTADELMAAQRLVRRLPVGESVVEAILTLVRSARPGPEAGEIGKLISWGPSPRASQALMLVARARALDRRPALALDRRRGRDGRADPQAPHGADLRRPRRRRKRGSRHRQAQDPHRIVGCQRPSDGRTRTRSGLRSTRAAKARTLAETLPRLILEARAHRRHRHPRAARPQARGAGRELLAVPPLPVGRTGAPRRLAPVGARRASLRTGAGMGGRAHGLDLARSLAVHGVQIDAGPGTPSSSVRLVVAFALAEILVQAGERVGVPGLMRPTGSRNVLDKMANAICMT